MGNFLEAPEFEDARSRFFERVSVSDTKESTIIADLWNERECGIDLDVLKALPLLLLVGAEDVTFLDETLELHKHAPHAQLEVFRGVGHQLSIETPDQMAHRIIRFLRC